MTNSDRGTCTIQYISAKMSSALGIIHNVKNDLPKKNITTFILLFTLSLYTIL